MDFQEQIPSLFREMEKKYQKLYSRGVHSENIAEDDVVTEIDQKMTDLVVEHFQNLEPVFSIQSEELAKNSENQNSEEPDYTVIFDEIDGTHNMIDQVGSFGPIVAVAEGGSPAFKDILAAGYLDLGNDVFYHAYRGKGAFRSHGFEDGSKIRSSDEEKLREDTGLLIDQAMLSEVPSIAREAWKSWCNDFGSQGQHFALVADGRRDGFITGGFSRLKDKNTAEELAGMYLIVKESGGVITDWKAEGIEDENIGMDRDENHNVIAAATTELADKISEKIIPEEVKENYI